MPEWVVGKVMEALNSCKLPLNGSKVLVLGVAYKKNIDDTRESPAFAIMGLLAKRGAQIEYSDPYIPVLKPDEHHSFELRSTEISEAKLSEFDCVIVVTNHDDFDYSLIQKRAKLIVDTRGVYGGNCANIVRA
jgi:UDP-N-acetyl-D-glucosamine dehydrogenase